MVSQYEEHGHLPCLLTWTVHTLWSCLCVFQFGTETKWTTGLNGSQFLIFQLLKSHCMFVLCVCMRERKRKRGRDEINQSVIQNHKDPVCPKTNSITQKKPQKLNSYIYILWISTNVLQELNAGTSFCDHCCDDLEGVNWIEVSYFELGVRDFGASNQIEINHHKKVY